MEVIKSKTIKQSIIFIMFFILLSSCKRSEKIEELLRSEGKEDIIEGAYMAGETGNKKFVPLLLENANDPRRSTNIRFKGISVYQSKMNALKKIFNQYPSVEITRTPDSTVIKFYERIAENQSD